MPVGSDFRVSLPAMGTSHANYALGLEADGLGPHPRIFKKHKVLPHPRRDDAPRTSPLRYSLGSEAALSHNGGSPRAAPSGRSRASRMGRGPEPPPTPPAHSRTSSASHPADPSTPNHAGTPSGSTDNVQAPPPATPPIQQTPPTPNLTPDRTPPGPAASLAHRRPPITDRNSSKLTTDSRAESFRTAPENPYSSDDDDGRATLRPALPSAKTSQSTVRQVKGEARSVSQPVGLGLGLESSPGGDATPKTVGDFHKFDGEWAAGAAGADAADKWDDSLMRNVTVRKRRPTRATENATKEIVDDRTVTPTNATKALRSMSLQDSPVLYPPRRVVSDRLPARTAPLNSESSSSIEIKRSSVMSTKSNASTVVEAMLVETAPQRRKTLRHVRKQSALRDSSSEISPPSSAPTSVSPAADDRRRRLESTTSRAGEAVRESYASTATCNSISSRKARRSVWKSGGVPVIVIPDRRSSVKSNSKSPSLRSTSSRRSQSVSSVPISQPSRSREHVPLFDRPARRSRALSESDGSRAGDARTMDFPPVIPARSSSLSAPTSRNVSRTGSLTAESLTAHNMFQAQQAHQALQKASRELDQLYSRGQPAVDGERPGSRKAAEQTPASIEFGQRQPTVTVNRAAQDEQSESSVNLAQARRGRDSHGTHGESGGLGVDRDGDPFFGKRLSVQNTPFSVISVETTATSNAEVSEAMAVNIYPHQSKSVVLVDHSAKPSESSTLEPYKASGSTIPIVKTTDANGGVPATPPQQFSVDDVDSPLRNPRAPPKPPAINFIPATPSGLTPSTEKQKQLGNYYEITAEKPKRSTSLLKRALTRRTTDYGPSPVRPVGFLTRTFSLSRNIRRRPGDWEDERPGLRRRSTADSVPQDETRLHPFWRPAYADDESCCSEDDEYNEVDDDHDHDHDHEASRTYRYPPIDNRPSLPRRGLSARIRRTFAILPQREDRDRDHFDHFPATADDAPDRRTIRRTPSGNLRVMKFRRSMESLTRVPTGPANPRSYTFPEGPQQQEGGSSDSRGRRLWRSLSSRARSSLRRGSSQPARPRGPRPHPPPTARAPRETPHPPVSGSVAAAGGGFLPTLGDRINLPRRLSERRREKRTQELRGMISAPREVRDGVGDVIRRDPAAWRDRDAMYVREQQAERQRVLQREQQQQQQQQQMLQHGQQRQRQPHHQPQRWEEEGWDGGV